MTFNYSAIAKNMNKGRVRCLTVDARAREGERERGEKSDSLAVGIGGGIGGGVGGGGGTRAGREERARSPALGIVHSLHTFDTQTNQAPTKQAAPRKQ